MTDPADVGPRGIPAFKRIAVVLGVFCAVLFVGSGFVFWNYGWLHLQAAFADEQTQIFDEMRTQALQSTAPPDIAGSLGYVVNYYPSGSKQRTGSKLDRVVERHRTTVVREIIAHLRLTTGDDLGESPEVWIQKYSRR
jgi:hypothetical protein